MFFTNLIIPLSLLGFGYWFKNHPPKEINSLFGYRTKLSMKNQRNWDFAQVKIGRIWLRLGGILLPLTILALLLILILLPAFQEALGYLIVMCQLILLILSPWPVQQALKKINEKN